LCAAEQRNDRHVVDLAPDQRAHAHLQRRAPADPNRQTVGDLFGNVAPGGVADDGRDALFIRAGCRHHDRLGETEMLFQVALQADQRFGVRIDGDLDGAVLARRRQQSQGLDAADAEMLGDLFLRQPFDIVEIGGPELELVLVGLEFRPPRLLFRTCHAASPKITPIRRFAGGGKSRRPLARPPPREIWQSENSRAEPMLQNCTIILNMT